MAEAALIEPVEERADRVPVAEVEGGGKKASGPVRGLGLERRQIHARENRGSGLAGKPFRAPGHPPLGGREFSGGRSGKKSVRGRLVRVAVVWLPVETKGRRRRTNGRRDRVVVDSRTREPETEGQEKIKPLVATRALKLGEEWVKLARVDWFVPPRVSATTAEESRYEPGGWLWRLGRGRWQRRRSGWFRRKTGQLTREPSDEVAEAEDQIRRRGGRTAGGQGGEGDGRGGCRRVEAGWRG